MNEEELVNEYSRIYELSVDMGNKVAKHFFRLAKKAIKEKDINSLRDIISRCPDTVTCCLILDAVKQVDGLYERLKDNK
jgi:hypothetical protein